MSAVSTPTITQAAVEFLELAATGRAREAWDRFGSPGFVHHNPWFPGDGESLIRAMDENARANPEKHFEIRRTISEGSLVAVHGRVHHRPGDRGAATVHIFRFEDGRMAELWDIGQEVPEHSPNQHGMF